MTRLLGCLLLSAIALLADVTGKWSGTFIHSEDGETKTETALLNLKQEGNNLSGTAGPSQEEQMTIRAGKIDGDKITFEIAIESGPVIKFELALAGDRLKGTATRDADGQKQSAQLDLTRQ